MTIAQRLLLLAFLGITLCFPSAAQVPSAAPATGTQKQAGRLREGEFFSQALQRRMKYRVLLPTSYKSGTQRYPVLYLLHGLHGSYENWTNLTKVEQYSAKLDYIIAMPDANNSWYTNYYKDPRNSYEDYIIRDFIMEIERQFRTIPDREDRVIAGLSMGGYAAMKFAIKYPQLFRLAGSFSGALNAPAELASQKPEFTEQLNKVYGPADSTTRSENDVFKIAGEMLPPTAPYLYLDCGTADYFMTTNREFTALLHSKKFAYEYHELPGGHNWSFWDQRIRYLLDNVLTAQR